MFLSFVLFVCFVLVLLCLLFLVFVLVFYSCRRCQRCCCCRGVGTEEDERYFRCTLKGLFSFCVISSCFPRVSVGFAPGFVSALVLVLGCFFNSILQRPFSASIFVKFFSSLLLFFCLCFLLSVFLISVFGIFSIFVSLFIFCLFLYHLFLKTEECMCQLRTLVFISN